VTTTSDSSLRAAYGAHGADTPDSPHPAPELIADAVERHGSEADRLQTLDHIGSCARCRSEFELLRSTRVAARESARSRWPFRVAGLAAAAAVVVGVTLSVTRSFTTGFGTGRVPLSGPAAAQSIPADRGPTTQAATNQAIALIAPLGSIKSAATRFVWHGVAPGTMYHVEVLDDSGAVVARANTADTVFTAPPHALAPGRLYRWWVQATVGGEPWQSGFGDFQTTEP
jgi:hypothetical protein